MATLMEFLSLSKTYSSPAFKQSLYYVCVLLDCYGDISISQRDLGDLKPQFVIEAVKTNFTGIIIISQPGTDRGTVSTYFTNIFKLKVHYDINSRLPESCKFNVKKENKSCCRGLH